MCRILSYLGTPVLLEGVESVKDATIMLENAMRELAGIPPHQHMPAKAPEAELTPIPASAGGGQ